MAAHSVPAGGVARVGAAQGVLYTDLPNPTSNSIYQAVGYRPDREVEERALLSAGVAVGR
ncbi:MAG: GNAT family N-acetyltransferase [Acidimicrobiales bacterium]